MSLTKVGNKLAKPQDHLIAKPTFCVEVDGSIKKINIRERFSKSYLVIFFFTLGSQSESEDVLQFSKYLKKFNDLGCQVLGITSESPLAIKRWIEKDYKAGGFGKDLGYIVVSDKDLSLSSELGVARSCGLPAKATFIIDPNSVVRYSVIQRSEVCRSIPELLRVVSAFQTSEETGMATPAAWIPGDKDLIPTEYSKKVEYYMKRFGCKEKTSSNSETSKDKDNNIGKNGLSTNQEKEVSKEYKELIK